MGSLLGVKQTLALHSLYSGEQSSTRSKQQCSAVVWIGQSVWQAVAGAAAHPHIHVCQPGTAPASPALQFYDIPVVSLRSAVWRNLAAGIEGFQVSTASS